MAPVCYVRNELLEERANAQWQARAVAEAAKTLVQGREHIMAAYSESTKRFSGLYEKLAK